MRFLVYADLQATDGSELCLQDPGQTLQHYRIRRFYGDLIRIYKEYDCDGVIDLGDLTDDRSSIPVTTLDVLLGELTLLQDLGGTNRKLTGNHEQYLRDTSVSNWRVFLPYFKVIQDREIETITADDGQTTRIFYCSYPKDHAELSAWIAEKSKVRGRKILFGHFQVKGAYLSNAKTTSGVPMEALSGFDQVLLGHIHLPQSLNERVHYVGSPFQQDWGEAGQEKRVGIVDTDDYSVEWIPLKGYPEYQEVTLQEFQKVAGKPDEHRYRVTLNSHDEAEKFYANPACTRAVGSYSYSESEAKKPTEVVDRDWGFSGTLERYMSKVPPPNVEISSEEMLEFGRIIVDNTQ